MANPYQSPTTTVHAGRRKPQTLANAILGYPVRSSVALLLTAFTLAGCLLLIAVYGNSLPYKIGLSPGEFLSFGAIAASLIYAASFVFSIFALFRKSPFRWWCLAAHAPASILFLTLAAFVVAPPH